MNDNFITVLKDKLKKCDCACDHYYAEREYKDHTVHYPLYCTIHGYILTVPRQAAIANIVNDGVVVVAYTSEHLDTTEYEKALYETAMIRRREVRTFS